MFQQGTETDAQDQELIRMRGKELINYPENKEGVRQSAQRGKERLPEAGGLEQRGRTCVRYQCAEKLGESGENIPQSFCIPISLTIQLNKIY